MTLDDYRFKGLREKLIKLLIEKGISDQRVLSAMMEVPRHKFFEKGLMDFAYYDKPFPIPCGQTISQPYTVAFQSQLLDVQKGHKILEIGTGSGYQAAVLAKMGGRVFTIERQKELYFYAKTRLMENGFYVMAFHGDGYLGKPEYAPYDRILITCGAPFLPEALKRQVAIGGIIVVPVDSENHQIMKRFIRIDQENFIEEDHGRFSFVPMIGGIE